MSPDMLTIGSTIRIPLLCRGEYSQWSERFINYLKEQTDGEEMISSIKNGDQPFPRVTQVSIDGTSSTEQPFLKYKSMWSDQEKKIQKIDRLARSLLILGLPNDIYSLIDSDVNDAMKSKKKSVVITSNPLALVVEQTKVSKRKDKVVISLDSDGSDDELKKITALLAKAFNQKKFYSKPTNNNLRTSSATSSTNKKQEYVKSDDKKEEKKVNEKKRDISKIQTKMLLAKKDKDEQVLLAEDHAWMESNKASSSSSDDKIAEVSYYTSESESEYEYETSEYYDNSTTYGLFVDNNDDQEIFHDSSEKFSENLIESQIDHNESYVTHNDSEDQTGSLKPYVPTVILEKIIIDLEDEVVSLLAKEKENLETIESLKSKDFDKIDSLFQQTGSLKPYVPTVILEKIIIDLEDETIVQICLQIIDFSCSKHTTGNRALLTNFMEKFLGTVRFENNDFAIIAGYGDEIIGSMMIKKVYYVEEKFLGTVRFENNDFAVIAGYGDVIIGSMTIKKVYYVKGLGHNLFSVGQFCDRGLEVAFRNSSCFVRNEHGVDLLTGDSSSNLYTIALNEIASNSLSCLLAKASSSQSWLWHQRKIHQKHHESKMGFASNQPLYLLHMELCGPMRVESINGKRYVLVVVDDFSRYTWLFFLHSKDEAFEVMISFIKKTQVNLQLQVQRVRTDNGTEFKNKTLPTFFDEVGISQQFSTVRKPQQNGVVERRNRPLVEAARTMLTFSKKLKAKRYIGVFVGYAKDSAAFRVYNKRTRKIYESVNVNFDEISEMASKQFSLEPGLTNLNEKGKSSNPTVSQVEETSKKDLEDLFHNFYDEYFDALN
uniref:Integrase catalytic domain-containing protein n=1 Tax=Tanacetum cinerariifolium TaxID=118510 RepID=A0A6L2NIX1_TANCI|nr:hypothetical protein [Tanacetum cinerariifolium]